MLITIRGAWHTLATLTVFTLLGGCGGGGGSGTPGIAYSGSTSPAALTQSNSGRMLSGAYLGGDSGVIIGGVTAGVTNNNDGGPQHPRGILLSQALTQIVVHSRVKGALSTPSLAAAVTTVDPTTVDGSCGGTATVSGTYNDANGNLALSAAFSGYCEEGTTLNGTISVTGQAIAGPNTFDISSLSITLSNLSASYGGDSFTATGSMTIAPQTGFLYIDTNVVVTLAMLLKDNTTSKVYKLDNFSLSIASTLSYDDIDMSGRYYDPDEGYIDLTTPATLRVFLSDEWPSSGSLRAAGNNSTATITATGNGTYQLVVDDNNDGLSDFEETGMWVNL